MAQEADLDLVEVAATARPPVCKLMDFGKYKYETAQKARESRRNQTNTVIKEMKLRPKIDPHDYETKKGHVVRFLRAGDKVKITIMFRGREQSRPELGFRLLQRLAEDVSELGFVESSPRQDGRNMIMVLGPHKKKSEARVDVEAEKAKKQAEREAEQEAERVERAEQVQAARGRESPPAPRRSRRVRQTTSTRSEGRSGRRRPEHGHPKFESTKRNQEHNSHAEDEDPLGDEEACPGHGLGQDPPRADRCPPPRRGEVVQAQASPVRHRRGRAVVRRRRPRSSSASELAPFPPNIPAEWAPARLRRRNTRSNTSWHA